MRKRFNKFMLLFVCLLAAQFLLPAFASEGSEPPEILSPSELPEATLNAAYSFEFKAASDTPITWELVDGDLPEGLDFDEATGKLSGYPAVSGTFEFTLRAVNEAGEDSEKFVLVVAAKAPVITTETLPNGTVGKEYDADLSASGSKPITWEFVSGNFPDGLNKNTITDGNITGTPTKAGEFTFKLRAKNEAGSNTKEFTITIFGQIKTNNKFTTTGYKNVKYSSTITLSGGTAPYTAELGEGTLPTGLKLSVSGKKVYLKGKPTATGIFKFSVKVTDSKGQSAVAAAAYRSGTKLCDSETDIVCDYTKKHGIVYSEISLCADAPKEYLNRETLWNAVHKAEKSKTAQLWREIEVALPCELSRDVQIETVRDFVKGLTQRGMCADWSLHDKGDGNPHAHIMLTMRSINPDGSWAAKSKEMYVDKDGNLTDDPEKRVPELDKNGNQKIRKDGKKMWKRRKVNTNDWNEKERIEEWRTEWENCCNLRLKEENRIDHRSFERQGITDLIPTIHEGYTARKIEEKGGTSERVQLNNDIKEKNKLIRILSEQLTVLKQQLSDIIKQKGSEFNERVAALIKRAGRAVGGESRRSSEQERLPDTANIGTESDNQQQQFSDRSAEDDYTETLIRKARAFIADQSADIRKSSIIRRETRSFINDTDAERSAIDAAAELAAKILKNSGDDSGNIGDDSDDPQSEEIQQQLIDAQQRIDEFKRQQHLDNIRKRQEQLRAAAERERAAQERKEHSAYHHSR